jgi:uncharacterized membrane protein YhaH (DUF805 family)/Tfp pilus assembly protein PilE
MSNPYQTPTGQLQTEDDQAYGEVSFFNPSGRLNRLRYWAHGMTMAIAFYAVIIAGVLIMGQGSMFVGGAILAVGYIAMLVFSFILVIQRLHDLNKSGWMSLLMLVPLANIYLFVLVIFFRGTPGKNNYGLQTPPNKTWHWIMAFSFPVLMIVVGVIAAISIPAYQNYVERSQSYQEESYDTESSASDEYYYEEQATDTQSTDTETTDGEYYESDSSETSESENYESDAEAELESMIEDETTEDSTTEETPAQ